MANPTPPIQVIERMGHLLDAIARYDEPTSLKVLSADTGLHPSTAFRILASLTGLGYVERSAAGHYGLGAKLMYLGGRVSARGDLRPQAKEVMEWLRNELGESINLTVRQGDEVVYIERATTTRVIRVEQVIGGHAPLHVTAVGKLMLGELGEQACRDYAQRTGLRAFTPNTRADVEALIKDANASVRRGYALDDEEAEPGVGCIGVLVRDSSGGVVAGLSVSAPIERRRDDWIPQVMEAGRRLSERLGYYQGDNHQDK
jgi:DNA-binding IclR family transcriptional regulator